MIVLKELEFYHGFLPREDLFCLLKYVGEFLVRVSEVSCNEIMSSNEKEDEAQGKKGYEKKVRGKVHDSPCEGPKLGAMSKFGIVTFQLKNVIIRRKSGRYLVEVARLFETIPQLINHYRVTPGKLNKTKGCSDLGKAKIKEMMKEARLMRNFKHRNVVRIYGVAVDEQPLYIILELVSGFTLSCNSAFPPTGGALNTFLKENANKVEVKQKLDMCLGAALGVEYLHLNQCMHRDLAARNCLITTDKIVKISDFGLSRLGVQYKLKSAIKLPIKWLAPETITTFTFSLKTDVFSFGVLVYEIFADGTEPWDGQTNAEVKGAVIGGKCVTFPKSTPEKVKKFFVERVFAKNPEQRATMTEVVKHLQACGASQIGSTRISQMSEVRHSTESRRSR
ncbi:unnamed protein product [Angiostrongylus costaricensis]|uniref:Tyrosine-protein kinase n=1 Tax=Angiostrongylus costaricensis TaxID=334426 RepID=A0A0R3Q0I0_ANGCS|nr:unnamed protein product [Angiostrongylus costaricensis]